MKNNRERIRRISSRWSSPMKEAAQIRNRWKCGSPILNSLWSVSWLLFTSLRVRCCILLDITHAFSTQSVLCMEDLRRNHIEKYEQNGSPWVFHEHKVIQAPARFCISWRYNCNLEKGTIDHKFYLGRNGVSLLQFNSSLSKKDLNPQWKRRQ